MTGPPVVVVGGGLSGIAAALDLADRGRPVVLLERRPFLGGRAFSFRDPDSGAVVDNGQHVLVGACDRLRAFLARIGSPAGAFVRQPRLDVPLLDGRGRALRLRAAPLPAPFHALVGLLRYRGLPLTARLAAARSIRALVATRGAERAALDPVPLGDWLAERAEPREAVDRLWDPLVRPALNVRARRANLPLTAFFLERALWSGPRGGALWLPAVGLADALGRPALAALRAAGVDVRLGARARAIRVDGERVAGVEADGGLVEAGALVAAVPPEALDRLLPDPVRPGGGHARLGASPIVNVYLWYDRAVLPVPYAGVLDSPLQWVFDRARLLGDAAAGGPCVGVSLSAADEWVDLPKEEIAGRCDDALARLLPARRAGRLVRSAVVKEPRATFRAGPGVGPLRPGPRGPAAGLFLAGDWTATGWPATMEGAVRSGEAAARAVVAEAGAGR